MDNSSGGRKRGRNSGKRTDRVKSARKGVADKQARGRHRGN